MPDVDSTLRLIGQWKYIITTDLTSAFYQIPLSKESMKYCGVSTPYRGTRVYVCSAMGMPGSETALEELMCRVLGKLLQAGAVAKLADDLYFEQSTTPSPETVGVSFAADVIKRKRKLILVLRECITSFTTTTLIQDERHQYLRDALVRLCIELRPLDGPPAVIRTDPAPGFKALVNDPLLRSDRLSIEIGRVKNNNKYPVAERAVEELQNELLRQDPSDGYVSLLAFQQLLQA
ncbi:Retrovirus-related Pol poly from transposon opus [Paramuricea clavata]|uniref:Retrovirus-related Pol poly from transposon opus n=1 Tax=Paramuricea clavata TaxID=317549 RepID=A0A6S7I8R6_PARCT|nr:Retrovirus-related Pol poly from transposon opus [Paramuricea clavata]